MTTEAQLAANRRNAMKSTGPRTPEGKAVVGLNNMKHGLLSRESLVKGESEAELVDFGKRIRTQLAPMGELELLLVDRIISNSWRLRRIVSVETMIFNGEHKPEHAFAFAGGKKMGVLSRYEVTLERSLYKALHELQTLQAERQSGRRKTIDVEASVIEPEEADEMALNGGNRAITGEGRRINAGN